MNRQDVPAAVVVAVCLAAIIFMGVALTTGVWFQ